jgi:hypothetical protein
MTETPNFMDGTNFTEANFAAFMKSIVQADGYVSGVGSEVAVIQHTPADMIVIAGTGEAWVQGVKYTNSVAKDIAITAAHASLPRIDRIILRLTWAANTCQAVVLTGTAAVSPAVPTLTQDASTWEISLAQVAVAAAATSILTANITDERLTNAGVAACRLGKMHIELDGSLDASSLRIHNLLDPSADQDADTKAARVAAIAALATLPSPAGSGYKVPAVNVGGTAYELVPMLILASASATLQKSSDASGTTTSATYVLVKTIVVPPNHIPGGVYRVKFTISAPYYEGYTNFAYGRIYIDGVATGTERSVNSTSAEFSEDLTLAVAANKQIQLYCKYTNGGAGGENTYSNFRIYCTQTAVSPTAW